MELTLCFVFSEKFGLPNVMFLYAAMSFVLLVFVILCIPETKGRTLEEISKELAKKWVSSLPAACLLISTSLNALRLMSLSPPHHLCFIRKHFHMSLCKRPQLRDSLIRSSAATETPTNIWDPHHHHLTSQLHTLREQEQATGQTWQQFPVEMWSKTKKS